MYFDKNMRQYLDLSKKILSEGEFEWNKRTETGTISLFGEVAHYDLKQGFPLLTTKDIPWRIPFEEMNYFFRGESDLKKLTDKNIRIWNENGFDFYLRNHGLTKEFPKHSMQWNDKFNWYINQVKNNPNFSKEDRSLGRIYGVQARDWTGKDGKKVDQLKRFLDKFDKDPSSRSNIVSHFNPAEMEEMSLGPCHLLYQSRVIEDEKRLDVLMFQRSCDNFLGVPFNIAQYSYLMELASKEKGFNPGRFSHLLGNLHYYLGPSPRSDFLRNKNNLKEFQGKIREAKTSQDYLDIKDWYLSNAPRELEGTEGLDQVPFALIQFSREPRNLPTLEFKVKDKDFDFWKAIDTNVTDLLDIKNYNPHSKLIYELDGKEIKPRMAA